MHDRLLSAVLALLKVVAGSRLVRVFFEAKRQVDIQDLLNRLSTCGERIHIQWPVVITSPETVYFGSDVSLAAYVHIWGEGEVHIGSRVMIGTHTAITSMTHDYTQDDMYHTAVLKRVIIEDDVWIGMNCMIMPNVHIGQGAVIGAGSVVTHDVDAYSIVTGVPAKFLKTRPAGRNKKIKSSSG